MEADDLLCSRNARHQKARVGRARVRMTRAKPKKYDGPVSWPLFVIAVT